MKNYKAVAAFVVLVAAIVCVVSTFWRTTSPHLFYYDEADYMYAGTRGFAANYLDRPSLSTAEFVRKGIEMARSHGQHGSQMSQYVRSYGDITFYRHYHGPTYAYWIALNQALGVTSEATYRASGLILHIFVTILIFLTFRIALPEYPVAAGLAAALCFLMDRTALVTATNVTQHVMFGVTSALTLLPLALYCRTRERRYWYLTAAMLGLSFATVESSFVLVGAVILVLALTANRANWKATAMLLVKGLPIFLAVILLIWPKGLLELGVVKGYLYLAYIAVVKKTFTPMNPFALWAFKLRTYPEEFILPGLALIALTVSWRKLRARMAVLPYLAYTWTFFGITMVITAPYTYYHESLVFAAAVLVGIAVGEIWQRKTVAGVAVFGVLLISLGAMTSRYYGEALEVKAAKDSRVGILNYIRSGAQLKSLYVPYVLVPTVHYYLPDISTTGYDAGWSAADLAASISGNSNAEVLCEKELCEALQALTTTNAMVPVMESDKLMQMGPLYALSARSTSARSR